MARELGLHRVCVADAHQRAPSASELKHMVKETGAVALGRIIGYRRLCDSKAEAGWSLGVRAPLVARSAKRRRGSGYDARALRGWCNRQHSRFWPCRWGFESSPPSSV